MTTVLQHSGIRTLCDITHLENILLVKVGRRLVPSGFVAT